MSVAVLFRDEANQDVTRPATGTKRSSLALGTGSLSPSNSSSPSLARIRWHALWSTGGCGGLFYRASRTRSSTLSFPTAFGSSPACTSTVAPRHSRNGRANRRMANGAVKLPAPLSLLVGGPCGPRARAVQSGRYAVSHFDHCDFDSMCGQIFSWLNGMCIPHRSCRADKARFKAVWASSGARDGRGHERSPDPPGVQPMGSTPCSCVVTR